MQGYEALRERAAWIDLSSRGRLRATGEDRVRLLHAMCTNHIEQLEPGQGCYAFFLNAQGRILADVVVLALDDALLLDTEPETAASVAAHLDKYIIADDVVIEDLGASTTAIGIESPQAASVLEAMGAPVTLAPFSHAAWGDRRVVRSSVTGLPGYQVIAPLAERDALVAQLEAAGAAAADPECVRTVRLECGKPRYGEDISDRYLVHETQVLSAVHFSKGCYIGQEIVERVRSRGGVHRFLVPLRIESDQAPAPGAKITAGGREAGEVTSAAYSPALREVAALGYVRRDEAGQAPLEVEGMPARIHAPAPLGAQ